MAELSPMMQQYLEIKKQHKDEILFYRIGDFYEMFFDDALTASKELDLTLTGKQCGMEERAPMCGVPFHSYEGYVARLIAKGYKVAICEQVEDPAKAKGLVKRDIIRVVTPGTVIESSMLQDDRNNYIASIFLKGKKAGLCFADVSTGTAHITELNADKIAPAVITELCRYHPSEVLMNPGLLDCREVTAYIKKNMTCSVELIEEERYAPGLVTASLENQFGRDWAQTTGIAADGLVRFAMAALLEYLHDTQIKGVERLKTVITYNKAQFMRLSPVTRANLELTETLRGREKRGTLLWVLDKTSTSMGKRMLRSWIEQPLISSALINHRLNAVESLVKQTMARGDLTEELGYIADMERLMTRTVYGSATPKEIYTLAQTCDRLPGLRRQAEACGCPELAELAVQIDPLEDIKARIYAAVDPEAPSTLKDGGVIAKGYHAEVDELRSIRDNTKGVLAQLEARLRQETGIPKLKIGYNHVFGYYIEVSNSYKSMVPETYIRKQTLTSGERYITQELKELESKILGAHERLITLERRLFDELLESISAQLDRIPAGENGYICQIPDNSNGTVEITLFTQDLDYRGVTLYWYDGDQIMSMYPSVPSSSYNKFDESYPYYQGDYYTYGEVGLDPAYTNGKTYKALYFRLENTGSMNLTSSATRFALIDNNTGEVLVEDVMRSALGNFDQIFGTSLEEQLYGAAEGEGTASEVLSSPSPSPLPEESVADASSDIG